MVNVSRYEKGLNYHILGERLIARGFKPYIVDLHTTSAVSASEFEFITGASTALNVIFGNGTATKLDIISASTDDINTIAGHTRSAKFWGIDGSDNLRVGTINMDGTTANSSINTYKELNDLAGFSYGSAISAGIFDAKGNIDIGQTGKVTNELFRIAANANTIDTARLWIPKNWRARIIHTHIGLGDAAAGRSTGILMFPHYQDYLHQGEDSSREAVSFFHEAPNAEQDEWDQTYGNDDTMSRLTFFGTQINNADTWDLHSIVLIWATHAISGSQNNSIAGLL